MGHLLYIRQYNSLNILQHSKLVIVIIMMMMMILQMKTLALSKFTYLLKVSNITSI